jgi:hypothetical protein
MMRSTSSPVPTGTVDLVTITAGLFRCSPPRATACTKEGRHGRRRGGWGAHRDEDRARALDALGKIGGEGGRPAFTLPATSSASPGS